MIPGAFQYLLAGSLPEALCLLEQPGEDSKILAGGQSLIPLMRFRLAQPERLIDINGVTGLADITGFDGWLRIGALARESELERSAVMRERYQLDSAGNT